MKLNSLLLLSAVVLTFAGCRKEKETIDNTVARDNSTAETFFNDLFKTVDYVSGESEGIRDNEIGCIDQITVDTTVSPRTVLIDFGTDDCVGEDGRIRKGQIFVTYSGRYRDEGTVITITPQNYTVNGYLIEGTKVVTNLGLNPSGQPHFSVQIDGTVTAPGNAWDIDYTSQRTRTWIEGFETPTIWDDVYEITGTASGTNRFDNPYDMAILTPLRVEIGCPWIVSGEIKIEPEGAPARTVDFGSGDCNAGFTVEVNGNTYPISGGN